MGVNQEHIPAELQEYPQWVLWRAETRDGKQTKVPYQVHNPRARASVSDPETWATFQQAWSAYQGSAADGIGFVLTEDDPFTFIDLDSCRDPESGRIKQGAQRIIQHLDSYTAVSPSGTGFHVWVKGSLPARGRRRRGGIEMYDGGRYATVTGDAVSERAIEARQNALDRLYERIFRQQDPDPGDAAQTPTTDTLSDEEILEKAMVAKNGDAFRELWNGDWSEYPSQSEADLALCSMLAFWTGGDAARTDALFRRSGLMREKWNQTRGDASYGQQTIRKALSGTREYYTPPEQKPPNKADQSDDEKKREPTQAEILIQIAEQGARFVHTPAGEFFGVVTTGRRREVYPLRTKGFRRWLIREFAARFGKPPGSQALQDALGFLEARAEIDGEQAEVHVRLGERDGAVYVDLGDSTWRAVRVTPSGWQMVDRPSVYFWRPRGLSALPAPEPGKSVEELRRFVNLPDESDWILLVAWLVAALRPVGPYPLLVLQGEQGAGKSTVARMLKALIDPGALEVRTAPREERDLLIAATNSWALAFDNLSGLPVWLSDALCRLATGGGFGTRELYSDSEEILFNAMRPVITNGIEDIVTRGDLQDRALLVSLPAIPEEQRRPEREIWADFRKARPRIVGALLNAVSAALKNLQSVELQSLPRMADFAEWVTAAESALPWPAGAFLGAYSENRAGAVERILEADNVASAIMNMLNGKPSWTGNATDLLEALEDHVSEKTRQTKYWPSSPSVLGRRLSRAAGPLRQAGVDITRERGPGGRHIRICSSRTVEQDDNSDLSTAQQWWLQQAEGESQ